jgi:hypothetical protein
MALPLIAAGIVARAVGKKLASRAVGGITGSGAKQVSSMYRNTGLSKAEAKANARGLKAANKPLSKGNQKLVTQIKQQTGYIAMDRRPTPPTVKAALGGKVPDGMRGANAAAKKIAMQEARSEGPAKKISAAQKALNQKLNRSK